MYLIYGILTNFIILISPVIIFYRILKGKEDIERFQEKFCIYKKNNISETIWFHAASVGEFLSILPILYKMEKNVKIKKIILTTSSISSARIFNKYKFKKTFHKFFPLDNNYLTKKFIKIWKPQIAIFVESEIWPNMFKNLNKKKIPIIILNARITKKSFNKWIVFPNFANKVFDMISLALPQNLETKKYLNILGASNIKIAGNLKFFGEINSRNKDKLQLKKKFRNFKVWCAASTHEKEEIFISKLHSIIKKKQKKLLTIIIPRHVNRSEKIINDLKKSNFKVIKHSSKKNLKKNTDIYLVDTYGESSKFYDLSNITFVGGSIAKKGGQNPLEPARLGNHILNGPNVTNFNEIYAFLNKNKISITSSNILKMKDIILKKLDKKLSTQKRKQISVIGKKILNKNFFYLRKYLI